MRCVDLLISMVAFLTVLKRTYGTKSRFSLVTKIVSQPDLAKTKGEVPKANIILSFTTVQ